MVKIATFFVCVSVVVVVEKRVVFYDVFKNTHTHTHAYIRAFGWT